MDSLDHDIVDALVFDGRTSFADLAKRVGLSGPSTAERVRKLESEGVIERYTAVLNPDAVAAGLAAFVAVSLADPQARGEFIEAMRGEPAVLEVHHSAGDDDYLLKVRCADTHALEHLVSDTIKSVPGVARTRTTVVLSTVFERSLELPRP